MLWADPDTDLLNDRCSTHPELISVGCEMLGAGYKSGKHPPSCTTLSGKFKILNQLSVQFKVHLDWPKVHTEGGDFPEDLGKSYLPSG